MERREWWASIVAGGASVPGFEESRDDAEEGERETWGLVWVPVSRWKSSVGSEVVDEASSLSSPPWVWGLVWCGKCVSGITETMPSSFVLRVERLDDAVSNSE